MVGICHNVFWTEPKHGGPFYAHVRCISLPSSCYTPCILRVACPALAVHGPK